MDVAVSMSEAEMLRWLFSKDSVRALLMEVLGFTSNAAHFLEVKSPFVFDPFSKPGDIDFLACERDSPNFATVIEFKRIKVRKEKVNKVIGLGRITDQLDGLYSIGFCKSYLGIIAVVDGRHNTENNFAFRGAEVSIIQNALDISSSSLPNDDVGVFYIEVVQTTAKPVNEAGMICAGIVRPARPRLQSGDLSQTMANFVSLCAPHDYP